ncbi:prolyl oligopeptidase family serine peptidase [Rhodococcus sp. HM1]|uniref:alpha/beta hydrolase family protein n=1 Tax=unclassified Rhodococcus (in: high G+C Gram-positive bacteria) TaxID=192944 RepID=UPI0018CD80C5|nr:MULTISPECIES: alpha/beta fold hydrolase [unclassified Rhodococcus (in: high G+C Gram-positive bacteria)]MBH0120227.1 prolyl oligopeptidase family serine peptidase [Rhodococcus sp. CX]MCK8670151.1 prolyl oligopeptidase family serine peptidase [Rhodococcus sp. HM1]
MSRTRIAYGSEPQQFGHLYLPDGAAGNGPVPVVMVIHGGYWNGNYHLNLGTPLATELARRGVAAWNIEYRRLGAGGRWPEMSADVVAALDATATLVADHARAAGIELDPTQVRVVGHSAGGQLAVWLAGEDTAVRPSLVVGQAAALDLASAGERGRRVDYLEDLFGEPFEDNPHVYRSASPRHRVPIGRPIVLVHGSEDEQVPAKVAARYADAAREAGDEVALHVVDGEDHFAFLNKDSVCWKLSLDLLLDQA